MLGRRLAIVLPDLRPGGAEKLRLALAREWTSAGIGVDFVLRREQGALLDELPAVARVVNLGAKRVRHMIPGLFRYLRTERPDALLAAMWPLTVVAPLVARLAGYRGPVLISEHAPQSLAYSARGRVHGLLMRLSMRLIYPLADARVAVSSGVADDMARLSGMRRDAFEVIHNPAATGRVLDRGGWGLPIPAADAPMILTVGTLKPVKRHDLLIRAFARLPQRDARLCIVGEGPERARLEALAGELGVADRIMLPGYQPDPSPWYAHADLFVLTSAYEGFGNVIVEALEQGTPVVSTDCPFGPREILEDGKYGTLVPMGDADALTAAMAEALSRPHDRSALRRRASEFSVERAAAAYARLMFPGDAQGAK